MGTRIRGLLTDLKMGMKSVLMLLFWVSSSCLLSHAQEGKTHLRGGAAAIAEAVKWRADLRYMAQEMPKRHKNLFHTMTRDQFEAAVNRLDKRIPTLARHQIIVELARIVAAVGRDRDGHTSLPLLPLPHAGTPFKVGFGQYPIKLGLYSNGFFVESATSEKVGLLGARVIKIGSVNVEGAFNAVSEIVSRDNDMTLKSRIPPLLTVPEVLHALGLIANMESARFTLETNGNRSTVELSPMTAGLDVKWVDAGGPVVRPLWLKDPNNTYWFEYLAGSRTVFFQYNGVANKHGGESLNDFFIRLFAFIDGNPVDRLVIDMRWNKGGNGVRTWPLIYGIIRSDKINKKGRLFAIIGRHTYSAGSASAAMLGLHTNVIFAGEPSGGGINVYGDHASITLPNSGIEVLVAPYYFQNTYPWDERAWIAPQIAAEISFDDYRGGNDSALTAILNYKSLAEVLTPALEANDLNSAIKQYRAFKSDPLTNSINTESEMNSLGYRLLSIRKVDEALEIFRLNVESYPDSQNAHDSLGDAYATAGNKELAAKSYRRALELDPGNENTANKLSRLIGK